ncbi:oxygenase domain protein [Mycobacterium ulcerans str. Harvey]|nr:oxygenase domain protein [Mycobacterium ulcerans str. Harvey]
MCGARPLLIDLADGDAAAAAQGWADRVEIVHTSIADRPAAAMLIRPDGYVAWAANAFDTGARGSLRDALQRWFGSHLGG